MTGRLSRTHLVWLGAVALLARAMVPAGWMPSAAGGFAVQLCLDGLVEGDAADSFRIRAQQQLDAALAGTGHRSDRSEQGQSGKACAFAAAAMAGPEPEIAAPPPPPAVIDIPTPAARNVRVGQGLAAPPPPARGPPAFA